MNDIFYPHMKFSIVYLDNVLIFSKNINEHRQYLDEFIKIIKENGLVVSTKKIKTFQTKIRFLGYEIYQGTIKLFPWLSSLMVIFYKWIKLIFLSNFKPSFD